MEPTSWRNPSKDDAPEWEHSISEPSTPLLHFPAVNHPPRREGLVQDGSALEKWKQTLEYFVFHTTPAPSLGITPVCHAVIHHVDCSGGGDWLCVVFQCFWW